MPKHPETDGSMVSFTDQGSGFPTVFLHGWMMSKKVWHYQRPLNDCLRTIAVDLRGHGDSQRADFSYDKAISDLRTLLDLLQIDKTMLVGWSMGSQIAIRASLELRERISGLILVGGTPRFCTDDDYPHGLPAAEIRGMEVRLKRDYNKTARQFFREMFSDSETARMDLTAAALQATGALPPVETAIAGLRALNDTDLRADLADIVHRTLIIHGAEDRICPPGAALFMAERIPSVSLTVMPATGHAPFISLATAFNRSIAEFAKATHG